MTIALAMQAGVTTYLQAELDFIGDINRIDSGLVGHAGMLIITRNQAWDDYTREVRESSPDSVEARSLKTKYAALDYRCEEFVQRHPAEFLYAMMGLINGD